MDTDRIKGTAKETFGKAEASVGDAIGDNSTEATGHVRQAAGAAQDVYGQAKDAYGQAKDTLGDSFANVSDSFASVSDSAGKALHSLEREVKARPLIALLIAALIGYVLAQLTTN